MESSGTVIVQVFSSRAQIPVPEATVAITRSAGGGRFELLAVRVTDQSGRTIPLTLPAPPAAASEIPGGTAPFALIDVWVQAPGFEFLLIEDVQIFSGVQTVQNAMLIPLPEQAANGTRGEVVQIPPQNL